MVFECLTRLKINFLKSKICCFGEALERQHDYAHIFTCATGVFPFRYLGVPFHLFFLHNFDWKPAEEKVDKGAASWQGGLLPMGGRLTVAETCLSSISNYFLTFFVYPKGWQKVGFLPGSSSLAGEG